MIDADVPCGGGGHKLRRLGGGGGRPPRGAPVTGSVLQHERALAGCADPAWMRRLAVGAFLLLAAAAWRVAQGLLLVIAPLFSLYAGLPVVGRALIFNVGIVLGFAGLWWLTTPPPL